MARLLAVSQESEAPGFHEFSKVFAVVRTAAIFRDIFSAERPSQSAQNTQDFNNWLARNGLSNLEEWGNRNFPNKTAQIRKVSRLDRLTADQKAIMLRTYPTFGEVLAKLPIYQLETSQAAELAVLRPLMNAGTSSGGTAPGSAAPATGVVYSVIDINSIVAKTYQGAADRRQRNQAATAAIKALGATVLIGGKVAKRGNALLPGSEAAAGQEPRWTVYLYDFADERDEEAVESSVGRDVVVRCSPRKVDVLVEFGNCRLVRNATGLTRAQVPLHSGAFRRVALKSATFRAAPGQGSSEAALDGLYLKQAIRTGVGGMILQAYVPFLLFKDGRYYDEPHYAMDSFNEALSMKLEPQNWAKFRRVSAKEGTITWNESSRDDGGVEDTVRGMFRLIPAPAGKTLSGTYQYLGGGGNTAYGGNTSIIVERSFTFLPGGRFQQNGFAGGSSGGDYGSDGPTVSVRSRKGTRTGVYKLAGYSLELRYDDGEAERLIFGAQDNEFGFLCIGGTMYLKPSSK